MIRRRIGHCSVFRVCVFLLLWLLTGWKHILELRIFHVRQQLSHSLQLRSTVDQTFEENQPYISEQCLQYLNYIIVAFVIDISRS